MIEWRKRLRRPPNALWCDECLRWEIGRGPFERPVPPLLAQILWKLSNLVRKPGNKLGNWLCDRAEEAQVRKHIRDGCLYAMGSLRESK